MQVVEQQDKAQLAALIYSSGEDNLNFLFSNQAQTYLQFALDVADGQFGFANQHIIRIGAHIVACASCWTSNIPQHYHNATLKSLISFFGTEKTASILQKSSVLTELLSPPLESELGIGHFAVSEKYRRQGLGRTMLDFYTQRAKHFNKLFLALDVAAQNQSALDFYYRYGFQLVSTKTPNQQAVALNLNTHLHLRLSI